MTICQRFITRLKSSFIKIWLRMRGAHIKGRITLDVNSCIIKAKKANLKIGRLYLNRNSSIVANFDIEIGNNVIVGESVHIYDHNHKHELSPQPFSQQGFNYKKVIIGNNVWICSGVIVCAGSIIGDNCVIGANCVVNYKVPDNSIVRCDQNCTVEKIRFEKEGENRNCSEQTDN